MVKVKNPSFFQQAMNEGKNSDLTSGDAPTAATQNATPSQKRVVCIPKNVLDSVKNVAVFLQKNGFPALAQDVVNLYKKVQEERFTVAFVGEFSRGKSTIINRLLNDDILPVGNLPTTALLTRITHGAVPTLTAVKPGGQKTKHPLKSSSWESLTANNFNGADPEGHVIVEVNDQWLGTYGIDLLDTPGAGDLDDKRARVIERCIVSTDAAVITVSATSLLSLTEQAFIRHKVLSRDIPFVALAISKLDEVKLEERDQVLDFLYKKLASLKMSLPVVIADDSIELPSDKYKRLVGVKALKMLILGWLMNEKRQELTQGWLINNVKNVLNLAKVSLSQQKAILDSKAEERIKLIEEREAALSACHTQWQKLYDTMLEKCQKCIDLFTNKANDLSDQVVENLQHEVGRVMNPKEWLENEYQYRVKRNLQDMSSSLETLVTKTVTADMKWLNNEMSKQFKSAVKVDIESINAREDFRPDTNKKGLQLNDMKDQSTRASLISSTITLGAALLLGMTGGTLLIATMGVGTLANIKSRKILDKKVEAQREEVKKLIAEDMPAIIKDSTSDAAIKIKIMYNDIISEAYAMEASWMKTQRDMIHQMPTNDEGKNNLDSIINELETIVSQL